LLALRLVRDGAPVEAVLRSSFATRCADEKQRLEKMESNVSALEDRAMKVNALLRRAVGAKTM